MEIKPQNRFGAGNADFGVGQLNIPGPDVQVADSTLTAAAPPPKEASVPKSLIPDSGGGLNLNSEIAADGSPIGQNIVPEAADAGNVRKWSDLLDANKKISALVAPEGSGDLETPVPDKKTQVQQNLLDATEYGPQEQARLNGFADTLGVEPDIATADPRQAEISALKVGLKLDRMDSWNPAVIDWMSNPYNARVGRDDVDNLNGLGAMIQGGVTGLQEGYLQYRTNQLYDKQRRGIELTAAEQKELNFADDTISGYPITDNAFYNTARGAGSFTSSTGFQLLDTAERALPTLAAGTATGALTGALTAPEAPVIGAVAGGVRGFQIARKYAGAVGAFDVGAEQIGGMAYRDFSKIKSKDGQLIDPQAARAAATYVAGIGGVLSLGALEQVASAMGGSLFKGWAKNTVAKALTESPTFQTALVAWAKKYGTSVATQGAVNGSLELTNIVGSELLKYSQAGQEFEHLNVPTAAGRVGEAVVGGSLNAALPLFVASGITSFPEMARLNKSIGERTQLEGLNNASEKSQVPPAAKASFAQQALNTLGITGSKANVYLDADTFIAHFTGKNEDPTVIAEKLGISDQLKPGAQLVIPKDKYIGFFAGTQDGKALLPHTTLSPDGMSESEIKGVFDRLADEKKSASDRAQERLANTSESERNQLMVEQAAEAQMLKGGTGKSEAKAGAKYYGAFFSTLSNLTKTSAFELYKTYGGDSGKSFDSSTFTGRVNDRANFDPNINKITLFNAKDPSSFLHESAHRFWHILDDVASKKDAPTELKTLHGAALSWLGAKSGEELTEAQQEQWAKAFEGYLQDGKAPTKGLEPIFKQYSGWLGKLYKDNAASGIENRGEINGIFGRLLGAADSVSETPLAKETGPMFKSAEEAGMTPKQFAEYIGSKTKAADKAQGAVFQKAVARVAGQRLSEYRKIRAEVAAKTEAEIDRVPVFRIMHYLETGEIQQVNEKTGKLYQVGKTERIALRREDLEYMVEVGAITKKQFKDINPRWMKRDGASIEEVAQIFDYENGGRMVEDLVNAPTKEEAVQSLVEQRMGEKYADVLSDENIAEATKEALLNNEQFKGFQEEIDALDKLAGRKGTPVKQLLAQASEEVSQRRFSTAIPEAYLRAATKAGNEAQKALLEKNYVKAAEMKRQQTKAYLSYNEATRQVAAAEKQVAQLRSYAVPLEGKMPSTVKSARAAVGLGDPSYLVRIDEILSKFGLGKDSVKSIEEKKLTLTDWVHAQNQNLNTVVVPNSVLTYGQQINYKEASLGLIDDVHTAVESIANTAKLERAAKDLSVSNSRENRVLQLVASLENNNKTKERAAFVSSSNKFYDVTKMLDSATASLRTIEMLCRQFDGDNPNGPLSKLIFEPIAKSYNKSAVELARSMDFINGVFEKYDKGALSKDIYVKEVKAKMAKRDILYVALQMGNEGNKRAFFEGNFDEATTKAILSHMTKADWETVQSIWDHLGSFAPRIAEHNKRITGLTLPLVAASAVETEHGTFRGGYFPLSYEEQFNDPASRLKEAGVDTSPYGSGHGTIGTDYSFRQERIGSGGKMVKVRGWGSLDNHLRSLFTDLNMFEAVRDTYKLVNDPRVVNSMNRTMGDANRKLYNWWISETIGTNPRARTDLDPFFRAARANSTFAQIGYKLTTALVQTLGYGNSIDELGAEYALKGVALTHGNPGAFGKTLQWVMDNSDFMKLRSRNIDRDIANVNARADKNSATYAYEHSSYYLVGALDMAIALPTWMGGYHKAVEKLGMTHDDAVQYADKVVRTTQGSGAAYAQPRVLTGGDIFKLMTMFQSYANVTYNRVLRHVDNVGRKGLASLPAATAGMLNLLVGPALLEQVMKRNFPTQENEPGDNAKKALQIIALQGVGYVPYAGNMLRALITNQDLRMTPFEGTVKQLTYLGKDISKEQADVNTINSVLGVTSLFTKIPASQLSVTLEAMARKSNGEDTSFLDYFIRPPKQQ